MSVAAESFIPLMRIGHCVFVSVPSELSDSQARFLQDTVSQRLSQSVGVRGLVMDVSALSIVDSFAAKILGETASIARQFGVKAVLVGVRPAVAITLVELGVDLRHVETALTLERALEKLRLRVVAMD
jgi:rsbT antagonist protein RsbS